MMSNEIAQAIYHLANCQSSDVANLHEQNRHHHVQWLEYQRVRNHVDRERAKHNERIRRLEGDRWMAYRIKKAESHD